MADDLTFLTPKGTSRWGSPFRIDTILDSVKTVSHAQNRPTGVSVATPIARDKFLRNRFTFGRFASGKLQILPTVSSVPESGTNNK